MISIKKREVKHIGAYIKFGIELNSCGIMPLKLLFAIFLFEGRSQDIISYQIKCYEGKISSHIDMWEVTYSVARLRLLRTSTVPDSWLFCMQLHVRLEENYQKFRTMKLKIWNTNDGRSKYLQARNFWQRSHWNWKIARQVVERYVSERILNTEIFF